MIFIIFVLYNKKANTSSPETYLNNNLSELKSNSVITENKTSSTNISTNENTTTPQKSSANEQKTYSYDNVTGLYKGTSTDNTEEDNLDRHYELYLYENGTFSYSNYVGASTGNIGNYTIIDNKINLNYLFNTGNDISLTATTGTKTLTINNDGSITDVKPVNSSTNLQLIKDYTNEDIEYFSSHTVEYLINHYHISNEYNENN